MAEPSIAAWDLAAAEHIGKLEHTVAVVEALSFDCIVVVAQIMVVVRTVTTVAMV